ncbi:MAG TPA: hypothetical protein PKY59_13315 [Pyrinomonadaceae bacterium]|nr:hypothetical protein [Pyrinomonadaceae bacterium]
MPVVIKDFEVVPAPINNDGDKNQQKDEKGKSEQKMTDHEIGKIFEKRLERLERISAN